MGYDYTFLSGLNICHKCGSNICAPNKKYCFDCLEKIREENRKRYDPERAKAYQKRRRELYQEHKKNGICVRCKEKATHGMYCYEHYLQEKRKSHNRAEKAKRDRHAIGLIPDSKRKKGECLWCEKRAANGLMCCENHSKIFSEAGKKGYQDALINKSNPWVNQWANQMRSKDGKSKGRI